jgi:hypothetical protein
MERKAGFEVGAASARPEPGPRRPRQAVLSAAPGARRSDVLSGRRERRRREFSDDEGAEKEGEQDEERSSGSRSSLSELGAQEEAEDPRDPSYRPRAAPRRESRAPAGDDSDDELMRPDPRRAKVEPRGGLLNSYADYDLGESDEEAEAAGPRRSRAVGAGAKRLTPSDEDGGEDEEEENLDELEAQDKRGARAGDGDGDGDGDGNGYGDGNDYGEDEEEDEGGAGAGAGAGTRKAPASPTAHASSRGKRSRVLATVHEEDGPFAKQRQREEQQAPAQAAPAEADQVPPPPPVDYGPSVAIRGRKAGWAHAKYGTSKQLEDELTPLHILDVLVGCAARHVRRRLADASHTALERLMRLFRDEVSRELDVYNELAWRLVRSDRRARVLRKDMQAARLELARNTMAKHRYEQRRALIEQRLRALRELEEAESMAAAYERELRAER